MFYFPELPNNVLCIFFFFLNRAMFTDGLVECQKDIISLNGVTAKGMKNLIDFAYSSKLFLDFGKFYCMVQICL